jgi:hypothetical protein
VTISDAARTENVSEALRILMTQLGERGLSDYPFTQSDAAFAGIVPTTWDELLNRRWIRATDSLVYVLTGEGWKAGLKLTGRLDDAFRDKAFTLVGLLKRHVVGRQDDAFVCVRDFESEGVSGGFVFNVVESRILEDLDAAKSYGLRWSDAPWNLEAPFFRIPRTFGQRRLSR